jgi:polar amino acid transport system substrate-binding protein
MFLFRSIIFLQLSLLLPIGAYAGEVFVLGAEDQAGPWGRSDGTGCGNDIVKAAFAASGDSVVLDILPYARAKKMAVDGELAGCFAMSWEDRLKGKMTFAANPLYKAQYIMVGSHTAANKKQSIDKLPPKSILGLVKDYEYPPVARGVAAEGVIIEETASEVQNLKKLAAGRLDATIVNCDPLKALRFLFKQAEVEEKVDSMSVVGSEGSFVGFSLRNPSGMRAKERFDKGMAIILKNGTYDSTVKSWISKCNQPAAKGGK